MVDNHVQFLKIKKLTGSNIIAIAHRHNLREIQAERGADSHINPLKTCLSVVLRGAGNAADIAAEAVRLMQAADVLPLRKNAVMALEVVISLPPDSGIDEKALFEKSVEWASFFEVQILSAIIHNDEASPHIHIILLPLFDGRMIGHRLMGNRQRLQAMQADFHASVGQAFGLARQAPVKRYSAVVRRNAADAIVHALQKNQKKLDDPAIRDALRDCLTETMALNLMTLLNLELPEPATPKKKTFAGIMTQNKPERKIRNTIANISGKNTIAFTPEITPEKVQTLSCVAFPILSTLPAAQNKLNSEHQPDGPDDDYIRTHDDELTTGHWDEQRGEWITSPPPRKRTTSPAMAQASAHIARWQSGAMA